ncbi:MAG: glycosyltransferase [Mameliella sp.]|nr:glycosyltransferase [Phaeodactylibacter sp.]
MAASRSRKVIGILYNTNPKWMGGVIYILNAIKILNWLPDDQQPFIRLYYRKELKRFVDEIDYPHLEAIEWDFPDIRRGYIKSWLSRKNDFVHSIIKKSHHDALFPLQDFPVKNGRKELPQIVSWYADLQHKHYPEFFSRLKLLERDARIHFLLNNCQDLVLSSRAVLEDFHQFFDLKTVNTHIFHFASVVDDFDFSGWKELRSEKGLPRDYFMVSNQFHKHKNHKVILEALGLLKQRGYTPTVAFTGRMPKAEHSPYIKNLYKLIKKHQLSNQVVLLGVLSRHEQLTLMRYAKAVLQPSLFEGWSTVIEDAISLQTPVIASNLKVNQEQLGNWAPFFDPVKPKELADLMEKQANRTAFDEVIFEPYDQRIKKAAESFVKIFN